MRYTPILAALAVTFTLGAAAQTAQQTLMGTCNKEASGKTGDERKAFMKSCLSAKPELSSQQSLMGTCNKNATGMKGDERKAFMKSCLSDGKKQSQERMKLCNVEAAGKSGADRKGFMSVCFKK